MEDPLAPSLRDYQMEQFDEDARNRVEAFEMAHQPEATIALDRVLSRIAVAGSVGFVVVLLLFALKIIRGGF